MSDQRDNVNEDAGLIMDEMNAERLVQHMMSWILNANERWMKKNEPRIARKLVWWNEELERLKMKVRRCRRAYQRERKRSVGERVNASAERYRRARIENKECIWRTKEANWKQFVSESGNRDP